MKVVLATIRRDHSFDLARQLLQHDALGAFFTGYPLMKLRQEGIPTSLLRSFPWLQALYMTKGRIGLNGPRLDKQMAWWSHRSFEAYTTRRLPSCDVFWSFAGCALKAGRKAQKRGAIYVCDRPSSHIVYQNRILKSEFLRQGLRFDGIDPRIMAQEEEDYAVADMITVPSTFAKRSFTEMGVSENKVAVVPYGVDLSRFHPVGTPDPERFEVLFVGASSIRKGIPDLLESFANLNHPQKSLTIVGSPVPETHSMISRFAERLPITCTGHCPQPRLKEIMSRSHVMVLPSVEEGLAMVQAQAMACGCPVIATTNTGAEDLFQDGVEGFIVPIREPATLTARMQRLADDPELRHRMAAAALVRVRSLGGWDTYGGAMIELFSRVLNQKSVGEYQHV